MSIISRKSLIKILVDECKNTYRKNGLFALCKAVNEKILSQKVKFPLLEYSGIEICTFLPEKEQLIFCDEIEKQKTIGGDVLLGIILQLRLKKHFSESIEKASEYISYANSWHICDTVGERVFGYSLLHEPTKTLPIFIELSAHESQWVVRSLGAGAHYAIKKGLDRSHVEKVLQLLISMANQKNKEIKQGVGWAAKTTAKFHPELIEKYKAQIENREQVGQWFRGKIKIGLSRNLYVQNN